MTTDEVLERVEKIRKVSGDDEVAHGEEDNLHVAFIEHMATSTIEPEATMARLILSTSDIRFARWCA